MDLLKNESYNEFLNEKLKITTGELFSLGTSTKNAVIIHGANCFQTMGAGVARIVSTQYSEAYEADLADKRKPEEKLGSFSYHDFGNFIIANAYAQFQPGANFNYNAIEKSLTAVRDKFSGREFFFPEIGSGIAGGDKNIILKIFKKVFKKEKANLILWDGK